MKSRLLACVLLVTATAAAQSDRKFLKSKLATEKHLPFSSAVQVGQTLYIAGTTADTDKLAAGLSAEQDAKNIIEPGTAIAKRLPSMVDTGQNTFK